MKKIFFCCLLMAAFVQLHAQNSATYFNTTDQTTNYEKLVQQWNTNVFEIGTYFGGTASNRQLRIGVTTGAGATNLSSGRYLTLSATPSSATGMFDFNGSTGVAGSMLSLNTNLAGSSSIQNMLSIQGKVSQTGTAGYRGLLISPNENTLGSGTKYLIDAGTNSGVSATGTHSSKFVLTNSGNVGVGSSYTSYYAGYTGISVNNASNGGYIDFLKGGVQRGMISADDGGINVWGSTGSPVHIITDGNEKVTVQTNGHVGIGYTTPLSRLEVTRPVGTNISTAIFHSNGGQAFGHVLTLVTDGDAGDDQPKLLFNYKKTSQTWAIGGQSVSNRFGIFEGGGDGYSGSGFGTERLTVLSGGNVGIGTSEPNNKLDVNGTIHSREVKVDNTGFPMPDYVFKKDYRLRSLLEVQNYIEKNHHLPDVPSALDVEREGMNLGEMNKALLKKVEELTLYVLKQNAVSLKQQKINGVLLDRVKRLERAAVHNNMKVNGRRR